MKLVLGTMTFSDQVDESSSLEMIKAFGAGGNRELDTAFQYNKGKTESLLGKIFSNNPDLDYAIATKVNPWDGEGLKPAEVRRQFEICLDRLQMESVDLLYLHSPDLDTPVEQSLETLFGYFEQSKFKRLGLSNFAAWQVAEAVEICRHRGWMVPSVYQGLYNALNRDVERELLPCLRNYGIRFYAYNPLAGGMLTGKHGSYDMTPQAGRFDNNQSYLTRYWKKDYFDALDGFVESCARFEIRPGEAALRWMCHHSFMSVEARDSIILGASKLDHLKQNLAAVEQGPLPAEILDALDRGWDAVKADCFKYFRP